MSCLYVRLPIKIKEELAIKNLHPLIQDVRLPRQQSKKWCFIKFNDEDKCKQVFKHLSTVKLDNKKIKVSYVKPKPNIKNITQNQLVTFFIENLPTDVQLTEVEQNIKNVTRATKFTSQDKSINVKVQMPEQAALQLFSKSRPCVIRNHHLTLKPSKKLRRILDIKSRLENKDVEDKNEADEVIDLDYHGNFDSDSD